MANRLFKLIFGFLILASFAQAQASPANFNKLVDDFFDFTFQNQPAFATSSGFHQYDARLEDFSLASIKAEIAGLKNFLAKFRAFPRTGLAEGPRGDLDFLQAQTQARLLALENIPMWRRDPDFYTSSVTNAVFLIMKRNYAPAEARLRSVISRERQIPKVLRQARQNLNNPPRVYTEVALEQLPGAIELFENDVPKAFAAVKDPKLLAEFKASNQTAIAALKSYEVFVRKELLPKSSGDFRIGAENFRKKLLYEEMVDIPLNRLLQIGYEDLRRNQQRMEQVAAQFDPGRSVREVLDDIQNDHPAPDQLLQSFRDVLGGLRQFLDEKNIITTPPGPPPIVEETPAFQRALTTASMEMAMGYETKGNSAIFNVTLPGPGWTPQRVESWMKSFNRAEIIGTAIHEVYPGHYEQYVWLQRIPSKTRKLLYCNTNAEGWAHYAEQMMLDEGYGNGDLKLRMGQLEGALLRDARFIAGVEMHTGKMTMEQANQFFRDEGYQTSATADAESKRGTSDPTYLIYTLGKLQILKLREDYKKMKGEKFALQEFHDQFMDQGGMPMKIIHKAMLGDDSPTL